MNINDERYLREVGKRKVPTRQEELELTARIEAGDEEAVSELAEANVRFVISIAMEYQHRGLPLSDLISEGNVGLMAAARKFDRNKGYRFITYAVWWIRQAILKAIHQEGVVRYPTNVSKQASVLKKTYGDDLTTRNPEEMAEETGMTVKSVRAVVGRTLPTVRLDAPLFGHLIPDITRLDVLVYGEGGPYDDPDSAGWENRERVDELLGMLDDRSQTVIRRWWGLDGEQESLEKIGEGLGITKERVRQIRNAAIKRLRRNVSPAQRHLQELMEA